jgi:hypothetical protein
MSYQLVSGKQVVVKNNHTNIKIIFKKSLPKILNNTGNRIYFKTYKGNVYEFIQSVWNIEEIEEEVFYDRIRGKIIEPGKYYDENKKKFSIQTIIIIIILIVILFLLIKYYFNL